MNILALDTSTEYMSLALLLGDKRFHRHLLAGQTHSQRILPLLRELLDEAGMTMPMLDGIAFGAGPGSFTGLRIGCGVAQGLAFGADLPVIGISTLLAVAEGTRKQTGTSKVVTCLDARMGEVYHGAYIYEPGGWREIVAPGVYKPGEVPALEGNDWTGAGSGWGAYEADLRNGYAAQIHQVLPGVFPRAEDIAELARPLFLAGQGRPAAEAAPLYVRNKVALKMNERPQMAGLKGPGFKNVGPKVSEPGPAGSS